MIGNVYLIGGIIIGLWCGIAQFRYEIEYTRKWIRVPIIAVGNGIIWPLSLIVIISRHCQSKESFSKNKARSIMQWLGDNILGKFLK